MSDDTYQGYRNRETWALLLWVANDQGLYYSAVEWAQEYLEADTDDENTGSDYRMGQEWLEQTRSDWDMYLLDGNVTKDFLTMIEDIGSWWRIDATEVGAWLRELVDTES